MTPAIARRIGKAVTLLGSPEDGEALAAARAIGHQLEAAGMDWPAFGALVAAEATRRTAPAFTFAKTTPRHARKLIAHIARQLAFTDPARARLESLRERLAGRKPLHLTAFLSGEEIAWLDGMWRTADGAGGTEE